MKKYKLVKKANPTTDDVLDDIDDTNAVSTMDYTGLEQTPPKNIFEEEFYEEIYPQGTPLS